MSVAAGPSPNSTTAMPPHLGRRDRVVVADAPEHGDPSHRAASASICAGHLGIDVRLVDADPRLDVELAAEFGDPLEIVQAGQGRLGDDEHEALPR